MSIETIQDIMQSRLELAKEQRQVEAEAFAVMRTRPTFFALKLLLGIGHKGEEEHHQPEEPKIIEEEEEAAPTPVAA